MEKKKQNCIALPNWHWVRRSLLSSAQHAVWCKQQYYAYAEWSVTKFILMLESSQALYWLARSVIIITVPWAWLNLIVWFCTTLLLCCLLCCSYCGCGDFAIFHTRCITVCHTEREKPQNFVASCKVVTVCLPQTDLTVEQRAKFY